VNIRTTSYVSKRTKQSDRDGMSLPAGKTRGDCRLISRCQSFFGCNPLNEVCDWAPSQFDPKVLEPLTTEGTTDVQL
jgi:hypothetical protein